MGRPFLRREPLFSGSRRSALALVVLLGVLVALFSCRTARLDDVAWNEACALSGYSCAWTGRPDVVAAPLGALYGRYRMGDTYILINERIDGNLAYAVRVHEMVHYLQYKRGAWQFEHENKCAMEHEAFDVSNKVLRRLGETSKVVNWDIAKTYYGCAT